eukprot:284649_1
MSSSTLLGLGLSCVWIVHTLLYAMYMRHVGLCTKYYKCVIISIFFFLAKPIFNYYNLIFIIRDRTGLYINVNENGLSLELLSKYISYSTETCECKDINKKQILYNIIIGIMPSGDSTNIVRFDMNGNMLFVMHQRQRVFQMSLKPDSMNKLPNNQIGFQWIPPYFKIYFPGFMIFDIHIDQLQISDNLKHKLKTGDVLPIISGGPGCKSMEVVAIGPDVLRHMSSQDPHNYRQIPSAHVQSVSSGIQKRTQHADPNHPTTSIYPSYWSRQHVVRYGEAKVFDLPLDGSEAQNVLRRFYENSPRDKYQVVRMEFIQNQLLYEKYNQERRILDKLGEDKREILFHGTGKPYHQTNSGLKPDCNKVMKAIAQQGFRKEFSTQAQYGQGSYFAKK